MFSADTAILDRVSKNGGRKDLKDAFTEGAPRDLYPDTDGSEIELAVLLKYFISMVRHNLLLIVGTVAGFMVLGVIITLLITPKYQATSQILIEDQADQIIEGGDLQQAVSAQNTERFLQTQIGILKSRSLARTIVQAGKLANNASFFEAFGQEIPTGVSKDGEKLDVFRQDQAIDLILKQLVVDIPINSRIATITITSRSPEMSAKLANMYAERFIEYNLNQKYDSSSYARRFLSDQLEETRNKLTQAERDLNQYARIAGLIRMSSQGGENGGQDTTLSVTNSQLMQLNAAVASATAERISAEDRWKTLSNQPALSITEVNSNNAIMQLITAKTNAESELADELTKHKDGYATVVAKRAQIAELDRRINTIANSIKKSAEVDYQAALSKENSLIKQVGSLRGEALQEQDRGVQYSILKRVADTYRALYESLLARYNQLNASSGSVSNNVTIVDRADVPSKPSSPNLLLGVILSFVLGVFAAAAAVALKEFLDDAIRSPQDVEKKLGLSLLGLIPLRKDGDINQELTDRRSSASEAYRSLVTNLRYSTATGLPQVLAITSARESEGKSTTARAIATDIATLGKNVLIVDADLRRPTLQKAMNDTKGSGLTDILIGHKSFDEVVHKSTLVPTLSYVTALPIPPDPALILAGEGLGAFIEQARSRFDVVVLDCPPVLGLSDAPILASHADGLLFVIDASSFHRGAVKSALRRLGLINANLLGVVLNRFTAKSGSDDYDYYAYNYYNYSAKQD